MQDAKVVEYACLALSRIAEALARSPEHLDMLCNHGLVSNAVQLVTVTENGSMTSQLSISTYYGLIRLLTSCASGSHAVAESLLQANLSTTMRNLLARYAASQHVPDLPNIMH
jgi:E3 ubiquitin-protein ligase TRIP12